MHRIYDKILAPQSLSRLKLIAHRGHSVSAPQNSLAAFRAAGEQRYWAIETDVRKTADGVLVCCHNATVDSLYNGTGAIVDMTWTELSRLCYRDDSRERMPLFEEYLRICHQYQALPFIETKTSDIEDVLATAYRFFPVESIVLSSIELAHLEQVRRLSASVFIHHIFSTPDQMRYLGRLGRCGVSYNYSDLSAFPAELVRETHSSGALLCLRAGDTPETVKKMVSLGLDYIPTNRVTAADMAADGKAKETAGQ